MRYVSLDNLFDSITVQELRDRFSDDNFALAVFVKQILNDKDISADIITLSNADTSIALNIFSDIYSSYSVVLMKDGIIDVLHKDIVIPVMQYIDELKSLNINLRINIVYNQE